jgi:hypothetical protein
MNADSFSSLLNELDFVDLSEEDLHEDKETHKNAVFDKYEEESDLRCSKLTKELLSAMVSYIKAGASMKTVANICDIHVGTINKWMKLGEEDPDSIYGVFNREIKKADGEFMLRNELIIQQGAKTDPKWAAWSLSKRAPDLYGNKDKVQMEITGPGGMPLPAAEREKVLVISTEELKKMFEYEKVVESVNSLPQAEDVYEADEYDVEPTNPQ